MQWANWLKLDLEGGNENTITSVTYYSPQDRYGTKSETNVADPNSDGGDALNTYNLGVKNIQKDDLEIYLDTVKEEDPNVECENNNSITDKKHICKIEENKKYMKQSLPMKKKESF